jgi:YVTN family beta-propeller protein
MKTRIARLVLTMTLCGTAAAQTATLLVISKRDHTLALVDASTLRVTAKAPVGDDPHEVIASADGRTAWVSNYGFGAFHSLAVIDLVAGKALPSVDLGALTGPHGLTFVAGETWFTAEGAKVMGRLNPATRKVDLVIGTGQNRTHMIYVSPDGKRIITTNVSSGTVSLIDAVPVSSVEPPQAPAQPGRTDWNQTIVPVGHGSEGFDVSPDGREIWVANAGDGTISIIDWATKKVTATLQANVRGGNRLKFTPDGRFALVSAGPELVILNTHTRAVTQRIPIGKGSAGVLIEPSGARAFIACGPDNYVAVLDLKTMKITGHIDVGGEPDGMAWAVRR